MGLLNNIQAVDEITDNASTRPTRAGSAPGPPQKRRIVVTLDVGRNVVTAVVILGLVAAITVLYARHQDEAARVLVDILVAVVSAGLGLNVGERTGAREASRELGREA